MYSVKTKDAIASWSFLSGKHKFSAYEMRIKYAIIKKLQAIIEPSKVGSGENLAIPWEVLKEKLGIERDLLGYCRISLRISECLKDDSDQNYNEVRKALLSMENKYKEVEINGRWHVIRLIHKPNHFSTTGIISFELDDIIFESFLRYSIQYRELNLKLVMSFNSVYTMRFYEMVVKQTRFPTIKIATLRNKFCLEDKYKNNNDFLRFTVDIAKAELDEKSPYSFNYTTNMDGRHIDSINIIPKYIEANDTARHNNVITKQRLDKMQPEFDILYNYLIKQVHFTTQEIANNFDLIASCINRFDTSMKRQIIWSHSSIISKDNPKAFVIYMLRKYLKELPQPSPPVPVLSEPIFSGDCNEPQD